MAASLQALLNLRPGDRRNAVQLRSGEQKTLEIADAGGLQPHPLFRLLDAFGDNADLQRGAAFKNRMHNRLFRPAFMHVDNEIAVDFNFVRLEARQQR